MKRTAYMVMAVMLAFVVVNAWAQGKKKKPATAQATTAHKDDTVRPPVVRSVPAYLGQSNMRNGSLSKAVFDSLLKQGITAHDSVGKTYKVNGFYFDYIERNLYEDSAANPVFIYDNYLEYCEGSQVSPIVASSIYTRTKEGDTVIIDHIALQSADSTPFTGRSMRFTITK